MTENINELIDLNLKLICETEKKQIFSNNFLDISGNELTQKFKGQVFSDEMESRGLIRKMNELCIVEEFGYIIYKNGGWLNHLEQELQKQIKNEKDLLEKEGLEIKLAKSNLQANKLNKRIAEKNSRNEKNNRITTWINIAIGFINIALLIWQITKS